MSDSIFAREFDWCSLVVKKLMESVSVFEAKFNKYGFVRGCGGCTIFIVVIVSAFKIYC